MLDQAPGEIRYEEAEYENHWCTEIVSEMATKIESLRLHRNVEELAKFRSAIIEQAPVGVLVTDANGTVKSVNPAWRKMAGGDITGNNLFSIQSIKRANLVGIFRKALRGKEVQFDEMETFQRSDA